MKKFLPLTLACTAILTLQAAEQKKKTDEKTNASSTSTSKTDSTTEDKIQKYVKKFSKSVNNDKLLATAATGDLNGVKKALEEGADINYVAMSDLTQFTALAYASCQKHQKIVDFLISKGGKVYNNRFYSWEGYPTFDS